MKAFDRLTKGLDTAGLNDAKVLLNELNKASLIGAAYVCSGSTTEVSRSYGNVRSWG